jgi:hypothetical protein
MPFSNSLSDSRPRGVAARVLWPGLALAATLGAALALAQGPGKSATAELHRAALAYHRTLFDGEVRSARAWVAPGSPAEIDGQAYERASLRRGGPWLIQSVETGPQGTGTVKVLLFLDEQGSQAVAETETWRRDAAGRWRLFDMDYDRLQPGDPRRR